MKKFQVFLILLILILAAFLRLWKVSEYPTGFNADEAAIGYNAYSLLKTGQDEYGASWPLVFKSFGDYKPGLYFYLVLPFVKIFGLNELAVRLPSAILGILTVLLVYFLVKEIFRDLPFAISYSLFASFLLAISPWHLHFSRGGWETNTATFFITAGTFFFLKALKNPKFYLLFAICYLLSLYTYHSARIIVPFLLLILCLINRRKVFRRQFDYSKWLLVSFILAFILALPLLPMMFSEEGQARFSGLSIFADQGPFWATNEARGEHQNPNGITAVIFHNKVISYGRSWLKGYLSHFDLRFLFITGDSIERNKVPEMGLLYFFEIFTVAIGSYFLLKMKNKNKWLVFFWLSISPLASSLTFQTPHALRAHNMVIPLTIISAFGVYKILQWTKENMSSIFVIGLLGYCFIGLLNLCYYLRQYYVEYPKRYPLAWEHGFKELVELVEPIQDKYDQIIITDRYDQPYILFLFYLKYPPEKYQPQAKLTMRDRFGFGTVRSFDKFEFRKIDWEEDKKTRNALIIGTDEEIPDDANIIKTIYFQNNQPVFQIAER